MSGDPFRREADRAVQELAEKSGHRMTREDVWAILTAFQDDHARRTGGVEPGQHWTVLARDKSVIT